ncbi:unnamed protein product [Prunus armeniaca]|uniref:RNase H type-1 domain-containing protein n=1 Tax=Prunus armeniaca TaxID=36596 RepID=A0A6J5XL43_PRUAR|nr:unnamed protein product [Prunus armeniaca]CAB4313143.1 unnamed protein product [Prunus armeniaca]
MYSCKRDSDTIGARGVIRDDITDWTSGFVANLGKCQILETEVWGLFFSVEAVVFDDISGWVGATLTDDMLRVHRTRTCSLKEEKTMEENRSGGHPSKTVKLK